MSERWLHGPIQGIDALLQPVAHALLQARDEINAACGELSIEDAWKTPSGVASVAFHLQHVPGVLDRLFTYVKGEQLSQSQLEYLALEGKVTSTITMKYLLDHLNEQVDISIRYLATIDITTLTQGKGVGRKQVPSTVMGLLFHSAEHTMRHTGQLLVTVKVIKDSNNKPI